MHRQVQTCLWPARPTNSSENASFLQTFTLGREASDTNLTSHRVQCRELARHAGRRAIFGPTAPSQEAPVSAKEGGRRRSRPEMRLQLILQIIVPNSSKKFPTPTKEKNFAAFCIRTSNSWRGRAVRGRTAVGLGHIRTRTLRWRARGGRGFVHRRRDERPRRLAECLESPNVLRRERHAGTEGRAV